MKRKIFKLNRYSRAICLPEEFLRKLHWRDNQNLEVKLDERRKRMVLKDYKGKR